MSPLVEVKGRYPNQPVHSGLALEIAVGKIAADLDRRRLDPGFLASLVVKYLGFESLPFGVPKVHSQNHLRPVLGFSSAGSRMDRKDGVFGVILSRKQRLDLEILDLTAKLPQLSFDLRDCGLVFFAGSKLV